MRFLSMKAYFFPVRQLHGFAVPCDLTGTFFHQDLVLVALGIVMHLRRRFWRQRSRSAIHNHLRLRSLTVRRRRKIDGSGADSNGNVGLLLVVGRVLFDHDQRILFHGVGGAIVEYNLRHALGPSLYDVAFFQKHVVIRRDPAFARPLLHPDGAVESGEASLLRGYYPCPRRRSHSGHSSQHLAGKIVCLSHAVLGELRKRHPRAHKQQRGHDYDDQGHTAIGDRRPRNVHSRFAIVGRHVSCEVPANNAVIENGSTGKTGERIRNRFPALPWCGTRAQEVVDVLQRETGPQRDGWDLPAEPLRPLWRRFLSATSAPPRHPRAPSDILTSNDKYVLPDGPQPRSAIASEYRNGHHLGRRACEVAASHLLP